MQPLCAATSQARALQLLTVADHQQRTRGRPHFLTSTAATRDKGGQNNEYKTGGQSDLIPLCAHF